MMKRKQLNLLLGLFGVLLIVAVMLSIEEETPPTLITTLDQDAITHIEVRHPDMPVIALHKQDESWALTKPVQVAADPLQVNALLELASREASLDYPAGEMDLEQLGLTNPEWVIVLNDTELRFGNQEPVQDRRYIQVGDRVYLANDPPSTALDADYSDLVHAKLMPEGTAAITQIETPNLRLTQQDDQWEVSPNARDQGTDARLKLLAHWENARSLWRGLYDPETDAPIKNDYINVRFGEQDVHYQVLSRKPQLKLLRKDLNVVYSLAPKYGTDLFELQKPPQDPSVGEHSVKVPAEEDSP